MLEAGPGDRAHGLGRVLFGETDPGHAVAADFYRQPADGLQQLSLVSGANEHLITLREHAQGAVGVAQIRRALGHAAFQRGGDLLQHGLGPLALRNVAVVAAHPKVVPLIVKDRLASVRHPPARSIRPDNAPFAFPGLAVGQGISLMSVKLEPIVGMNQAAG